MSSVDQSSHFSEADNMAEKKKLTTLSISEKVEILDRLQNGEKKENITKEKKIGLRTLQRIKKAEEDIRRDAANILPSRKRKRTGRFEEIDIAMEKWFSAVRARKQIVSGSMILQKAKDFAIELGIQPYSHSVG